MRRLTSIVALNEDGVIGAGNRLPWRVKSDLQFFRKQTVNNVVVMGRKTFDSLGRKCLPERKNIVVTHGFNLFDATKDCMHAGSIVEALVRADAIKRKRDDVFIVGGASMYEQFAPYVDRYLITEIYKHVPDGDTYFDRELIGPISDWNVRVVGEGSANQDGDEANYKIYELIAKNTQRIYDGRQAVIESFGHNRNSQDREFQTYGELANAATG